MAKLNALRRLQAGWNGPGSLPIDARAIVAYERLIEPFGPHVPLDLEPIALNDGGIALEWHRDDLNFEVELAADGSVHLCVMGSDPSEDDERTYSAPGEDMLKRFYETGRFL